MHCCTNGAAPWPEPLLKCVVKLISKTFFKSAADPKIFHEMLCLVIKPPLGRGLADNRLTVQHCMYSSSISQNARNCRMLHHTFMHTLNCTIIRSAIAVQPLHYSALHCNRAHKSKFNHIGFWWQGAQAPGGPSFSLIDQNSLKTPIFSLNFCFNMQQKIRCYLCTNGSLCQPSRPKMSELRFKKSTIVGNLAMENKVHDKSKD